LYSVFTHVGCFSYNPALHSINRCLGLRVKDLLKTAVPVAVLIVLTASMWNWYDVTIFENWVRAYREVGLFRIYEISFVLGNASYRVAYPPVPPIIYIATHALAEALVSGINLVASAAPWLGQVLVAAVDHLIRTVLKLPLLVFTVALGVVLWRRFGSEAVYWTLLGVPTIVTLANYQFDPLVAFFLYAAVVLVDNPKWGLYVSALASTLAVLTKPLVALPLLPLVLYVYRRYGFGGLLKYAGVSISIGMAVVGLFLIPNPRAFISNVLLFHSSRPPQYISLWNLPVLLSGRNSQVVGLVNTIWLPVMLIAVLASVAIPVKAKYLRLDSLEDVVRLTLLTLAVVLVLNKVVNPNYLLWAYPLVVHIAFSRKGCDRGAIITYNLGSALAALWGGLYMLIPALVNDVVVIEETGELLPARYLIYKSLDTPLNETLQELIRIGEKYYEYVKSLENYTNIIGAALILLYTLVMLKFANDVIGGGRRAST